ncbi:hypothetical protein [Micromonospora mirobrigensis]|uniref:Uncharacterized protein n=1 Tax=Micromonospora mirobrigensis TaxID=262898 RepID=A0A1C4XIG5_9ACTN|nr:hypothetical protein [Micromonospora mirobrigensis]SCF08247.1 hypothetical protein GA0070564_103119 [Micromonospora mirobrigensis]
MPENSSPFFIGPHRFDAAQNTPGPLLDRRYTLVPEPGEQVIAQHRLQVSGYLLGPTVTSRQWTLPATATVTVTDRRVTYVCTGSELALVSGRDGPAGARHRRPARLSRLVSGEVRWQWPSRLELLPDGGDPDGTVELLVVCDALRTIRQPALALGGPAAVVGALGGQVRRAAATFRLVHPELVDLSPPERDELTTRLTAAPCTGRVTLPGALPVEFLSRDDYYRPYADPEPTWPLRTATGSGGRPRGRPGSAC